MSDERAAIRAYVSRYVDEPIADDLDLFATGMVSSLFAVQLMMWVERTFAVAVREDDLEMSNFCSIDAVATFVERRRDTRTAAGA